MFRSIRFWAIAIGVGLVLWLGRDQISTSLDKLPLQATPRTTDTKALASATPSTIGKTPTITSSSATRTAAPATQTVTPSTTMTVSSSARSSVTAATRVSSSYALYVVKKGDTLYSIAKRYQTSVTELQRINGISDPSKLAVGQELKVPQAPSAPASKPALVTPMPGTKRYKVQPGDTLSSIARKFQTSVAELQKLNNFSNPNQLVVGALILVPATSSSSGGVDNKPGATTGDQEVRIMPVGATAPSPPAMDPSPTPTPIPTMPSICEGNQEAVFVWGVSFCIPPGWTLQEYVQPYRTALLTKDESGGERSIYAISRLEGSPNAPLSWSMRQAKKAVATEIASLIPGGLAQPDTWTLATGFEIANVKGQMSETESIYLKTGARARVRVIVFNAAGQRWRIVMIAPEQLWQGYNVTVYPYIARTLDIF